MESGSFVVGKVASSSEMAVFIIYSIYNGEGEEMVNSRRADE